MASLAKTVGDYIRFLGFRVASVFSGKFGSRQ